MNQRNSGYQRVPMDKYQTPFWVTRALIPHIPERVNTIWEPACGDGLMVDPLEDANYSVYATDIYTGTDFLRTKPSSFLSNAIITNPPYNIAEEFCGHALVSTHFTGGVVAMLMRVDFDSAKTRRKLFADHPAWCKKLVLTDRIRWFEGEASPSFNHAWYIWDWRHDGPPTIAYGGKQAVAAPLFAEAAA